MRYNLYYTHISLSDDKTDLYSHEDGRRHLFHAELKIPFDMKYLACLTDGKEFHVLYIPLTVYYAASPPQPAWLHAIYKELATLRPRELPLTDLAVTEQFRVIFGSKKAFANQVHVTAMSNRKCTISYGKFSSHFIFRERKTN